MKIWKFPLQITDVQIVTLPVDSEILSVAMQGNVLCLWAMCDPDSRSHRREIEIIGTGNPIEDAHRQFERRFIGTVLCPSGLVWHVFERI